MKAKTSLDEKLLTIVDPIAMDMGFKIVRIRAMSGKRTTLQIMAERNSDGRMNVDDCATLSREISSILEVEDPILDAYTLEVSSPGLDRPLTDLADFEHYQGYWARIDLDRMVEGRKRFRGIIQGIEGEAIAINLDIEADATAHLPFSWISEAKLLITDELIAAGQAAKQTSISDPNSDMGFNKET